MAVQKTSLIDVLSCSETEFISPKKRFLQLKKSLCRLVLPYLGTISLQTRTKLPKSVKGVLNCCELQVIFKCQNKLHDNYCFKDPVSQILTSGVVCKFQGGFCNDFY